MMSLSRNSQGDPYGAEAWCRDPRWRRHRRGGTIVGTPAWPISARQVAASIGPGQMRMRVCPAPYKCTMIHRPGLFDRAAAVRSRAAHHKRLY